MAPLEKSGEELDRTGCTPPRVLLLGDFESWAGSLESSYERAFVSVGWEAFRFDMSCAMRSHSRFGALGKRLTTFILIEQWLRKANRDFVIEAERCRPHLIVAFCSSPVTAGGLAQAVASTGARCALIWPDTLVNLTERTVAAISLYDFIGAYSRGSATAFQRLGAPCVQWLPLAADFDLHGAKKSSPNQLSQYHCDVSFIGNYRPERESALARLLLNRNLHVRIWGGSRWTKAQSSAVRNAWQGRTLLGEEFTAACQGSKLCLNIIDATNYPAANMRFFEIFCTGSLQVCSACPEFAGEFIDGKHVFYYDKIDDLPILVDRLLSQADERTRVAHAGKQLVKEKHTYRHRVLNMTAAMENVLNLPIPSEGEALTERRQ